MDYTAFLLNNGKEYHIVHAIAILEYLLTSYLIPGWKRYQYVSETGKGVFYFFLIILLYTEMGGRALGDAIEFFVEKKINQTSDSVDVVFFLLKHRNCIDNRGTSTAVNGNDTRSQQLFAPCRIRQGAGACPSHRWHIQVRRIASLRDLDRNLHTYFHFKGTSDIHHIRDFSIGR